MGDLPHNSQQEEEGSMFLLKFAHFRSKEYEATFFCSVMTLFMELQLSKDSVALIYLDPVF